VLIWTGSFFCSTTLIEPKGVEVNDALKAFDANDSVRAIIITGNEKAFAGLAKFRARQIERSLIQTTKKLLN
jgi:enoyl-CoA hydratase/carnithine racemase